MKVLVISIAHFIFGFACDRFNPTKSIIYTYIIWFFVILSAVLVTSGNAEENYQVDPFENNVVEKTLVQKDFRFIPKGVPASHVNDNGTPSDHAILLIRSVGLSQSKIALDYHRERIKEYREKLEYLCWYAPEYSQQDLARMGLNVAVSAATYQPWGLGLFFLLFMHQHGGMMIACWGEIDDAVHNLSWSLHVAHYIEEHMASLGWRN